MASAGVDLLPAKRKFENIRATKVSPLPQRYVFPVSTVVDPVDRTTGLALPVIDLAGLSGGDESAREAIVRQIGNAASEWGFFQIVNHGFPEETIKALDQQAREFFELPVDVKERAEDPTDSAHGYDGRGYSEEKATWLEYFARWYRPTPDVESLATKIWPSGNQAFCKILHEYCTSAERVGLLLMELLAESLGLNSDEFSRHFQDPLKYRSAWRLHHYPACPEPSRALGALPHSDSSVLTILKQDDVGGLQVRKGDRYFEVEPHPSALVVNVGDTLEALSNGRFRSVEHRVTVNKNCGRISMVYLFYGSKDMLVECPPQLIDDTHPALYFPFTVGEYRANFENVRRATRFGRRLATLAFALRQRPTN